MMISDILVPSISARRGSSQCAVVFYFFCFGQFFPISKVSASTQIIVSAIHSARTAAAKPEIMDGFTFDDISTFFASDCIPNNSRHNHPLLSSLSRVYTRTMSVLCNHTLDLLRTLQDRFSGHILRSLHRFQLLFYDLIMNDHGSCALLCKTHGYHSDFDIAYFSSAMIVSRTLPILVIIGTTRALPMQKYLILSGIPVFVHSSSNP